MSVAMTKRFSVGMFLAFLLSMLMIFANPVQSYAAPQNQGQGQTQQQGVQQAVNDGANIGGVKFEVNSDGQLTVNSDSEFKKASSISAWNDLIKKYRKFIVGVSGIGAVSMIGFFIVQFMKLGASAGNPQARSQALVGVLWTGIAAAGLGAITTIVGFFYNAIG
jgi:hypothetical protein